MNHSEIKVGVYILWKNICLCFVDFNNPDSIVSIIVVEILNQDDVTYTTYNLSYDYDDLETACVNVEDLEEVIQCKGRFTGSVVDTYSCHFSPDSTLLCNYEVGDYVEKNECIFSKDAEEYYSDNSGVVSKINVGGGAQNYTSNVKFGADMVANLEEFAKTLVQNAGNVVEENLK